MTCEDLRRLADRYAYVELDKLTCDLSQVRKLGIDGNSESIVKFWPVNRELVISLINKLP